MEDENQNINNRKKNLIATLKLLSFTHAFFRPRKNEIVFNRRAGFFLRHQRTTFSKKIIIIKKPCE